MTAKNASEPSTAENGAPGAAAARPGFNDLFATLHLQYVDALPGKIEAISQDLGHELDLKGVQAARAKAHNLRGSAGAFGYKELGLIAGQFEDTLLQLARGECRWADVVDARNRLRAAVDHVVSSRNRAGTTPLAARTSQKAQSHEGRVFAVGCDWTFIERLRASVRSEFLEVATCMSEDAIDAYAPGPRVIGAVIDAGNDVDLVHAVRRIRESQHRPELPVAITFDEQNRSRAVAAAEFTNALLVVKEASEQELGEVVRSFRQDPSLYGFRVLVVDDDPDFSVYMDVLLRNMGVDVRLLSNASTVLDEMDDYNPDLVMLDIQLLEQSGLEVCRTLRRFVRWQRTPIVLITGRVDDEVRLEAYRAGASDFVSKPLIPEELRARVGVRLEHVRLLREYAEYDALTGLWNRRPLLDATGRVFAHARRSKEPVAVALIDIDRFKSVNDRYGHSAGDEVIASLGRLIRARFRYTDLRCRWGGEELLLVFDGSTARSIAPAIEDLLEAFKVLQFGAEQDGFFGCSFSAGIASFPEAGDSFDAILKRADALLYRAKSNGRSRVEVAP